MAQENKKKSGNAEVRRSRRASNALQWRLPPLPWMLSAGRHSLGCSPKRILIGGAIQEALLLAKSLPDCEVVVIDSSAKLVRALRLSAKRRRLTNLASMEASWDQPHLAEVTGRNFDLIILPGFPVASGGLATSLENLTQSISHPSGAIYLRVPGDTHPFHRSSEIFEAFGQSTRVSHSPDNVPPMLLMAAALSGDSMPNSTPLHSATFSLGEWISAFQSSRLHLAEALHVPGILVRALSGGFIDALGLRDATALATLFDRFANLVERHLVFNLVESLPPPWENAAALGDWCPSISFWPREKIPVQQAPFNRNFSVDFEIHRVLPKVSLQLSAYMLELLRCSDGETSLRDIMARIPHEASLEDFTSALWFFHHSCIFHLLPPRK